MFRSAVRRFAWSILERRTPEWAPQDVAGLTIVFSPHFDDETLGAGAAILKLRQAGAPVHIVFMTDGSRSHGAAMPGEQLSPLRREEGLRAAAALDVGSSNVSFLGFPETRLADHRDDAVQRVAEVLMMQRYIRVIVPSAFEPFIWSSDHRETTEIVYAALRRVGQRCEVLEYLVWFWYHWPWVPVLATGDARQLLELSWRNAFGFRSWSAINTSIDLGPFRARKRMALEQHRTQMTRLVTDRPWPILADVARGEFLDNFFGAREWFKASVWERVGDAS